MQRKYTTIADRLRRDIEQGTYADRLPSERQLAASFETTHVTVRKALDILVGEGLLRKDPPLGTFVQPIQRPRIRLSLLWDLYGAERIEALRESVRRAFPELDVEFAETPHDPADINRFDLLRSPALTPVDYPDFAAPYPPELVRQLDSQRYFKPAFDVHRINGHTYGMPLLFSPILLAGDRDLLQSAGCSLDPYQLDLNAFLGLCTFATRRNVFFWNAPLARAMFRSLVYSAGDESNSLAAVDPTRLRPLLERFRPTLAPGTICSDFQDDANAGHRILLRYCCRQAIRLFDPAQVVVLALPAEIRHTTLIAGEYLLLNNRSRFPEEAAAVAAHFLSPEIQQLFAESRIGLPVLKSAAADSIDSTQYRDDVFLNELKHACPNSAREHDFLTRLYSLVDEVIQGHSTYDAMIMAIEYEIGVARKRAERRERGTLDDYGLAAMGSIEKDGARRAAIAEAM